MAIYWARSDIAVNRLRELRESRQISIAELAARLYCSRRTIKRYERGEHPITPEIIPAILQLFHIQIPDLFPQYESSDGGATYCFSHLNVEGYLFSRVLKNKLDLSRYQADGSEIKVETAKKKPLPADSLNQQEVGQQIKRLREEKGLSATQFSRMTGLSRRTLGRYENGERPIPPNRQAILFEMLRFKDAQDTEENSEHEVGVSSQTSSPVKPLLALSEPARPLLLQEQTDLPWYGDDKTLITRLYRIREKRGWTREEFAGKFNVSVGRLAAWETGKEEIPAHHRLAMLQIFGVEPEALFPQLATFNGGYRYIPATMEIAGFQRLEKRGTVWPVQRYNKNMEKLEPLLYPKDLTVDEYFNLAEDMFEGVPNEELPIFDKEKLPRQYQLSLEAGKGYGLHAVARNPADAKKFSISKAKLTDSQRHFPKVSQFRFQNQSLILKYENNRTRILKLAPYWRGSKFYSSLKSDLYLKQGWMVSLPVGDEGFAHNWETQYILWPEGQLICLDEAFFYAVPSGNALQEEPYGYFRFFQQYIMMFQSDIAF